MAILEFEQLRAGTSIDDSDSGIEVARKLNENFSKAKEAIDSKVEADSSGAVNLSKTADKLTNARNIALVGDVSAGAIPFDGSSDIILSTTLKKVIAAGTYTKVTVNEKGIVIGSAPLTADDLPYSAGSTQIFEPQDETSMLALDAHKGDFAIRPDGIFLLKAEPASDINNWVEFAVSGGGVKRISFAANQWRQTGDVYTLSITSSNRPVSVWQTTDNGDVYVICDISFHSNTNTITLTSLDAFDGVVVVSWNGSGGGDGDEDEISGDQIAADSEVTEMLDEVLG